MTLTFTATQRQQLADCLELSQKAEIVISSNESKNILKAEYEKMKPEILKNLLVKQKQKKFGVKFWLYKLFDNFLNLLSQH
jgi:serine/threonine-protein kinase